MVLAGQEPQQALPLTLTLTLPLPVPVPLPLPLPLHCGRYWCNNCAQLMLFWKAMGMLELADAVDAVDAVDAM